jgi:hypothetical protein
MHLQLPHSGQWRTSSFGEAADTSPMEINELGQHMQQCSRPASHLFTLRCGVDAVHQGLLARFVTSLALVVALLGMAVVVW